MKRFSRVILAFAVAVLGFASLVLDAGLGSLRVNKLSTGFSRTPNQIVSTILVILTMVTPPIMIMLVMVTPPIAIMLIMIAKTMRAKRVVMLMETPT